MDMLSGRIAEQPGQALQDDRERPRKARKFKRKTPRSIFNFQTYMNIHFQLSIFESVQVLTVQVIPVTAVYMTNSIFLPYYK